jgi:uncharacterized protein YodC (DUF2158 family)
MTPFNRGDVVRLKSGGPDMVVDEEQGEEYICVWLDKNKKYRESFHRDFLMKGGKKVSVQSIPISRG